MDPAFEPQLVSVIVPTHNRASLVVRALQSVKAQTYRPIELIVVDDGSTDETPRILQEWMALNASAAFTCLVIRQDNRGAPAARNRGLSDSRGEFIQYLDSDDILHPQKLEVHVAALRRNPGYDFVWSDHSEFGCVTGNAIFLTIDSNKLLNSSAELRKSVDIFSTTGNAWSGLYRREKHRDAGPWNETLGRWQDVEFNIRFTALRPNCIYIGYPFVSMGTDAKQRIQHLYRAVEGVGAGLHTLGTIESTLQKLNVPTNSLVRRSLSNFYINLARHALETGDVQQAILAIEGSIRSRDDKGFRLRTSAIVLLIRARLAGFAVALMRAYSALAVFRRAA